MNDFISINFTLVCHGSGHSVTLCLHRATFWSAARSFEATQCLFAEAIRVNKWVESHPWQNCPRLATITAQSHKAANDLVCNLEQLSLRVKLWGSAFPLCMMLSAYKIAKNLSEVNTRQSLRIIMTSCSA